MSKSRGQDASGASGPKLPSGSASLAAARAAEPLRRLLPGAIGALDETATDRRLVDACLRGSEQAWAALLDKYRRLIYSIPFKYGLGADDAADIFQAVSLELFKELPRLRNADSVRAWLLTVTAHQAFHAKRDRERRGRAEVEGVAEEQLGEIAPPPAIEREVEREQMVRDAIARLSQRCRELIRMLFFEEPTVPYAQAATRLGLATGSIGFIRGRCLRKLEQALEELGF